MSTKKTATKNPAKSAKTAAADKAPSNKGKGKGTTATKTKAAAVVKNASVSVVKGGSGVTFAQLGEAGVRKLHKTHQGRARQAALEVGVTVPAVTNWFRRAGLPVLAPGRPSLAAAA